MAERLNTLRTAGIAPDDRPLPPMPNDISSPASSASRRASPPRASRARSPARLQKAVTSTQHARKSSEQYLAHAVPTLPSLHQLQEQHPTNGDLAGSTLLPPPPMATGFHSRSSSHELSRPGTPGSHSTSSRPATPRSQMLGQTTPMSSSPAGESGDKSKKKHWWNKNDEGNGMEKGPTAWIAGHPHRQPYDAHDLLDGRAMQELWDNDEGNCTVHLFPHSSKKGPSFKIDSAVFASSPVLTKLAFGELYSNPAVVPGNHRQLPLDARTAGLSINDSATPPLSTNRQGDRSSSAASYASAQETQLYLDVTTSAVHSAPTPKSDGQAGVDDLQILIDYRNLFAFLYGQFLVATERRSSFFSIFKTISSLLKSFNFTNLDGSTYGEIASASFDSYVQELGLADVRSSREKTIEGIVLGENMKSVFLYNEAFTHAAGKHEDLLGLRSPIYVMISPVTQNRLIRAAMDLEKRTSSVRLVLKEFEFPFLFSGVMNSKTSEERKEGVRFDGWKEGFLGMRKYFMGLYKHKYGDWPPKAKSKRNSLETSGLNRLVLQDVYNDLASMYNLLADRNNLTTRTIDGTNISGIRDTSTIRGLRRVLSEYDRSSPPVKPPVPFDLPKMPTLRTTRPDFGVGDAKKDAKAAQKKLKDDEIARILHASWNSDIVAAPFVDAFREMETRAAHGCSLAELEDLRIGEWIFMYVVLQALPMLVCDAPGLKWTNGVEYFLCEPPRSGVPWADPNAAGGVATRRTWFSVGGVGGGVVSLPSDLVEHGVEGIYKRSHCWQMAQKWAENNPILNEALAEQQNATGPIGGVADGLSAPPAPGELLRPDSRASNTSASSKRLSSLGLGLEALPLPPGVTPDGRAPSAHDKSRTPVHAVDKSRTFDAILADVNKGKGKKKK